MLLSTTSGAYENFSPVGDILVLAICIVLAILIAESFVIKDKSFRLFQAMIFFVAFAAGVNIFMHVYLAMRPVPVASVYVLRVMYHLALFGLLYLFAYYMIEYLSLRGATRRKFFIVNGIGFVVVAALDVFGWAFHYGFRVSPAGEVKESVNFFIPAYIFFVGIIFYLLIRYRDRAVSQISRGIIATFLFSFAFQGVQGIFHQMSFTTVSFVFPVITLMYLLHTNPYDVVTGALSEASFDNLIETSYKKKHDLVLMSLHLQGDDEMFLFEDDVRFTLYHFFSGTVKHSMLFEVSGGRLVLVFEKARNPEFEGVIAKLCASFQQLYERYRHRFKVVIMESDEDISRRNTYVKLIDFIEHRIGNNEYYRVQDKDIEAFRKQEFILDQLEDIADKFDLDDARVLAFCQPVYSVERHRYDTAEALMRLRLPDIGMVFPDQFIPLAEQHNLIHPLSLIILNKVCKQMKTFLSEGYDVKRISINFSMQEVRDVNFCEDIIGVIYANDIPYDKIAIELTESRNEEDFEMVKERIAELKEHGIKFYLDDFGTGYSNLERIMELPFDIIKFDRSMVIEMGKSKDAEYMVNTLSDMFDKLDYSVLYEGVEDEADERRCIRMFANYLQGYKYSRPIEIEKLRDFFSKKEEAA